MMYNFGKNTDVGNWSNRNTANWMMGGFNLCGSVDHVARFLPDEGVGDEVEDAPNVDGGGEDE